MLTIVEKVIFLQDVDVFEFIATEDLAYIAAITEEITVEAGQSIYGEGDTSDSMYVLVEGTVRLHKENTDIMIARDKDVFGTWALFDDEQRLVNATTVDKSRLLKVDKDDFFDLLSDHINITESLFKALVKRIRKLVEV